MHDGAVRLRTLVGGGSAVLAVTALIAACAWTFIFDFILAKQVALTPNSRSFRDWRAPSVPIYMDIFLFNWTNPHQFPAEKPHLEQLGPYRFREHRFHVNITWYPDNSSMSYRTQRRWFFDPETSNGTLDDNVTTLNVVAASAAFKIRHWTVFYKKSLSMVMSLALKTKLAVSKTAGELLFEGYQDSLMDMAKLMPDTATGGAPNLEKFGLFFGRNNSIDTDGFMEVTTGVEYGTLPGQVLRWNHMDRIPYYDGRCSELTGSAGEFLPRNLTKDSKLTMFLADLCRTVHMEYVDSGYLGGLPYHKYEINEKTFDYSPEITSNTCFCNGECIWSGVMNVSACRYGSPSFISLPHFLYGDSKLQHMVTGLHPDPAKHSFYFAVEPNFGVPLEVAARFQYNVYLEPSPDITLYMNVPRMLFPIFWVQQKVAVEESVLAELRMARGIMDYGCGVCASAAFAFALIAVAMTCYPQNKKPKYMPPADYNITKTKDEAELKLNPL